MLRYKSWRYNDDLRYENRHLQILYEG